jgi:hypothetical protein
MIDYIVLVHNNNNYHSEVTQDDTNEGRYGLAQANLYTSTFICIIQSIHCRNMYDRVMYIDVGFLTAAVAASSSLGSSFRSESAFSSMAAGIDGADMTSAATAGDDAAAAAPLDDDDDVVEEDGEPVAIERRLTGPFVLAPVKLNT